MEEQQDPGAPADVPAESAVPASEVAQRRRRLRGRGEGADDDTLAQRLAHQWSALRDERARRLALDVPEVPSPGTPGFSRSQVPWGLDLAAAWAWRFLVIVAAGAVIAYVVGFLSVVAIPLVVALLIAALVSPLVDLGVRIGLRRGFAALVTVIVSIATVALLLTFAGQQVASGAEDLADQTVAGLDEIRDWLRDGPLNASDSQINSVIENVQSAIQSSTATGGWLNRATEVGTAVSHVLAGFFIVLFASYFFLADGTRIWAWLVRLAPRAARPHVDSSGRVAWISLTQFVRATVVVAAVDAIGIAIGAWVLGVPFVLAIGVLVFLGAFIPMIGATIAGSVAVLVALVDQGPVTALLMLAVIIVVQQLEGHVLQPFLMGRWVSVHPLGVIVAIAVGVLVGGVAGALVAVPLAAALNAVVQHLAASTAVGEDAEAGLARDYGEDRASVEVPEEPA